MESLKLLIYIKQPVEAAANSK